MTPTPKTPAELEHNESDEEVAARARKAEEQKTATIRKQHEHEGPETRNTENRGPTANHRGK